MPYDRVNWNESDTPLNPDNLNKMDEGIEDNDKKINDIEDGDTKTNADQYKGNDIDSDGDGKVDKADEADKLDGQTIPEERFQISGRKGGEDEQINDGDSLHLQSIKVSLPSYKKLVLKRIRYHFEQGISLRIQGENDFVSDGDSGDETPDHTLETNDSGFGETNVINIEALNETDESRNLMKNAGWWLDLSIEQT